MRKVVLHISPLEAAPLDREASGEKRRSLLLLLLLLLLLETCEIISEAQSSSLNCYFNIKSHSLLLCRDSRFSPLLVWFLLRCSCTSQGVHALVVCCVLGCLLFTL